MTRSSKAALGPRALSYDRHVSKNPLQTSVEKKHGHECYPSLINHHVSSLSYVSSTTHDLSDDWDSDYDDDEEAEADARKRAMKADYSAASAAAAARAQKLAREDQKVDRDWLHMLDLMLELVAQKRQDGERQEALAIRKSWGKKKAIKTLDLATIARTSAAFNAAASISTTSTSLSSSPERDVDFSIASPSVWSGFSSRSD